jgi:hypothetical protein
MSPRCRNRPSTAAATSSRTSRLGSASASIAALSLGQLAKPAGDDELGRGQAYRIRAARWVSAHESLHSRGIAPPDSVAQFLGTTAELVEIGALGE